MAIVTLSRELGSLGTEIADALVSRLGFGKLDKESLEGLLKTLGMSEPQFERDDEKSPGFWEKLTLEKARYLVFMKAAMYRFAAEKDCVIIGRGGNIIFRGVPGTLKLRIVAPPKVRTARLCKRLGIDEQHALRMIRQSDHDRAGYHKYFFNAGWESSADYDLVVNTAGITPDEACAMVADILRSSAYAGMSDLARDVLRDLRIAQDVMIAIVYRERLPVMSLDVVCDKGIVALDAMVHADSVIEQCVSVAGMVEGVTKVVNTIEVVEFSYTPGI